MSFKILKIFASGLLVVLFMPNLVLAENLLISQWHKTNYSQARAHILQATDQTISLAVEINIIENYKTYWMSPGSTGVPPLAKINGANVVSNSEKISFPLPHKYINKYGETWGYKDRVVLFINVNRQQMSQQTQLNLAFDYAVCDQICLPEHAQFQLKLAAGNLAKTMSALRFGKFNQQITQPIAMDKSAIKQVAFISPKQLLLSLNSPVTSDLFITDAKHRFYQHASTDSDHQTYNLHGLALKDGDETPALTIYYATQNGYFHTKISTE